jgi:hypothetical protein
MEAFETKDEIEFYPFLKATKNSAKSVIVAQLTVPFGTVRRSAGLRPGVVLYWHIELKTYGRKLRCSAFAVGGSMFSNSLPGRRPALHFNCCPV